MALVLPSGCAGGCRFVAAMGVPCSHGSELPGKFLDSVVSDVVLAIPVADAGAAGVIGQNIELCLGIKPEEHGKGV